MSRRPAISAEARRGDPRPRGRARRPREADSLLAPAPRSAWFLLGAVRVCGVSFFSGGRAPSGAERFFRVSPLRPRGASPTDGRRPGPGCTELVAKWWLCHPRTSGQGAAGNDFSRMAAAPSDALVRQGCMKIPRKFLDAGAKAGAAGTDGDAYGHVRGLGGMSYDARAGAAAKHRDVVLEEMLLAPGKETVTFGDVVGLEAAKRSLNEAVVLPLVAPQFFTGARRPWNGVLLFGPPGSGKTLLARAVAAVNGVSFFDAGAAALLDKFWGESEKLVRALFEAAHERRPAIIFIDEVDALATT